MMSEKTVLVTGSTDGIGRQTALELAEMGATVLLHGRDDEKGRAVLADIARRTGNNRLDFFRADLASFREIRQLAAAVLGKYPRLDVLINNAGVYEPHRRLSADGIEMTLAVNHLAPFLLTGLLLPLLKKSAPARIIIVSSMAHASSVDFDNLQGEKGYSGYQAYATSKLCNILFTFELAERLAGSGVTANCLHPGVINTKLLQAGWGMGGAPPEEGARTPVYLASAPELQHVSGKYFRDMRVARPAAVAYDREARRKCWEISEQLTGFHYPDMDSGK